MSRADAIIRRVDAALKKVGGMSRAVYKRTITVTGGDSLTGRQTTSVTDTLFDLQPAYVQLDKRQAMLLSGSQQFAVGDYKFTFSVNSIAQTDLEQQNIQLVLKDSLGVTEILKIIWFNAASLGAKDVALTVIARSIGHV